MSSGRAADMAEKQRQEEKAKTDPGYNQASIFHNVVDNPLNYVAPEAGLAKTTAAAALHGIAQPAPSAVEQATSGVRSGALGAAGSTVAKFVPTARLAPEINIGGEGDALLKSFPSFKPTPSQASGGSMASSADAVTQSRAITKDLMDRGGIKADQLTPATIANAKTATNEQIAQILPKGQKLRVSTTDLGAINEVLSNPEVANAVAKQPTLRELTQLSGGGTPRAFNASDLHTAMQEISKTKMAPEAAQKLRDSLTNIIEKNVAPANAGKYKTLTDQLSVANDIERIYAGGAQEGKGAASGFLKPSDIVNEVGRGPTSQATQDAARLINKFHVSDKISDAAGFNIFTKGKEMAVDLAAKARNSMPTLLSGPEWAKTTAEGLRAGVTRGPSSAYGGVNAPQQ